jgi:peptide/nickel transport system permease protein
VTVARILAISWLAALAAAAVSAPFLTPYEPERQFREHVLAAPMRPHVRDERGEWTWPFVYESERRQVVGVGASPTSLSRYSLTFNAGGPLLHVSSPMEQPWFPLGTDHLGRDVWTRLLFGARLSLGLACAASALTLLVGAAVGAAVVLLGSRARRMLDTLGAAATAMPLLYLVIFLRALLPLSLDVLTIVLVLVAVFALAAWPPVAGGVRAIIAVEYSKDYVAALRASGAGSLRVLWRVLPTTRPFLTSQLLLLTPAFMVAESTLSFVGWGFPSQVPSWGTLLQEASNLASLVDYPWLLSSAVAIAGVSLALQMVGGPSRASDASSRIL